MTRYRILVAAGACAGLAACAPIAGFRPPSALSGDRTFEVGAGAAAVTPRPYVIESGHSMGQLWFSGKAASWLSLSAVGAFDNHGALGGGEALARFIRTDRFVAATGLEAGLAWGAVSLSGSARIAGDTWIYSSPRFFNWGKYPAVGVPFGLSARLLEGLSVRAEGQVSWENLEYYNRRIHFGAATAYDW